MLFPTLATVVSECSKLAVLLALLRCDPRSEAVLKKGGLTYEKAKRIVTERGIAGYYVNLLGCGPTFWSHKLR
jgi:hypothetical protein